MEIEIIIPCYNAIKTLPRALGSLLAQTDNNFLVHLIDDASTDNITPIVESFKNLLNIKVTRNDNNIGCGMSRQVGIDASKADYIAFLDADDILMPYTVEMWRKIAEENPNIDIFHSYFYEELVTQENKNFLKLIQDGFTWMHGKLYKLDFIKKWGIRNDPRVKYADDSFFNSMCMELGTIKCIPTPLYCWLNNVDSITRSQEFNMDCGMSDFATAMKLSTDFLKSKGVKKIKHIPNTIKLLEERKDLFLQKGSLEEYEKMMNFFYKENQIKEE